MAIEITSDLISCILCFSQNSLGTTNSNASSSFKPGLFIRIRRSLSERRSISGRAPSAWNSIIYWTIALIWWSRCIGIKWSEAIDFEAFRARNRYSNAYCGIKSEYLKIKNVKPHQCTLSLKVEDQNGTNNPPKRRLGICLEKRGELFFNDYSEKNRLRWTMRITIQ